MKPSTVRSSRLRYVRLLPVVVLGVATILATSSPGGPSSVSVVVSDVTDNACTHSGTGVTCAFSARVEVKNYTFKNSTATFVTTDLLVGQWIDPAITTNSDFTQGVAFLHDGLTCVGPQTTLAVYDGFTDTGTLVTTVQLNPPVSLTCQ